MHEFERFVRTIAETYKINAVGFRRAGALPGADPVRPDQVARCLPVLEKLYKDKRVNTKAGSSFDWKRKVEAYWRERGQKQHISNGAFIVAAISQGFSCYKEEGGVNGYFNFRV